MAGKTEDLDKTARDSGQIDGELKRTGRIEVLDKATVDQIAAGEVVERPSSVVKELVENSIDAGSSAVTVEITDGGKKLIRVTDNGAGIEKSQVEMAFRSHATSKIRNAGDLERIMSLGFRGEALSSIAAVARVELITRTPSAMSGIRFCIEGGEEKEKEETGAPVGSTFLVRDLFYNTPARSKFLKSDTTEASYIASLMEELSLSHPEISFKYIQNRQVKLHTSGNGDLKETVYAVYGRDIAKNLLELSYENDFMHIEGYLGKPQIGRGNRNFENFFINGRFVRDRILSKAVEDGYKGYLMQHKFPFVSLHIRMEGNDLDVNVHPSKMEVRFARGVEVYDALFQAVRDVLLGKDLIPDGMAEQRRSEAQKDRKPASAYPEPFEEKRRIALLKEESALEREPFSPEEEKLFRGSLKGQTENAGQREAQQTSGQPDSTVQVGTQKASDRPGSTVQADKQKATDQSVLTPGAELKQEFGHPGLEAYQHNANSSGDLKPAEQAADWRTSSALGSQHQDTKTAGESISIVQESLQNSSEQAAPLTQAVKEFPSSAYAQSESVESAQPVEPEEAPQRVEPEEAPQRVEPVQQTLFGEKLLSPEARKRHRLIGQIFDTYWLLEYDDSLYIMDQHAAHERVYYERFMKHMREKEVFSQNLNPPLLVSLTLQEEEILRTNLPLFTQYGFSISHFGGRDYAISEVPIELYSMSAEELFRELLDQSGLKNSETEPEVFARKLATMACKAAVKGNQRLSPLEADALIDELLSLENPYHCPHGRPTIIRMSRTEIEKKFRRIL